MELAWVSVSRWLEEGNEILHTHKGMEEEYYSVIKKNKLMRNKINGNVDNHIKKR